MNTCLYYVLREKKMFLPIPIIRCSRYRKLHNKYIKFMHNVMELNQSHFYKILILKRFIDVENNALCVLPFKGFRKVNGTIYLIQIIHLTIRNYNNYSFWVVMRANTYTYYVNPKLLSTLFTMSTGPHLTVPWL